LGFFKGRGKLKLFPVFFFTGVFDTGNKFTAGVLDTSDKFTAGVLDTGDKFIAGTNNKV